MSASVSVSHDEEAAYRDPIVQLLVEYRRVAATLWAEVSRHELAHVCGADDPRCELDATLVRAWVDTETMATALDFVALGELPTGYRLGYDTEGWLAEYIPGPWRDPSLPVEARP